MSGRTVTDKRIDAERRKVNKLCEQLYENTSFTTEEANGFCLEMAKEDDSLGRLLLGRPLSSMQVRKAFHAYTAAFKRACNAGSTDTTHGTGAR